jgi:CRISPR-associated protein Csb1
VTTTVYRTVLEAQLKPLTGSLFQPTGFPDLGAAEFTQPAGADALVVESVQSMANWLEATTWDSGRADQAAELSMLPYMRIIGPDGTFLSASRLEAHRLASSYIMDGTIQGTYGRAWLPAQFGLAKGHPLDLRAVARACFRLDPLSLLHGVFFAQSAWPWQPRLSRAITAVIEATGVRPVVSGGVKKDIVINEAKQGETARGYGTVPHHRVEYTADAITAYITIDHEQLRSYGLPEPATALLGALADYEIAALLSHGLRLRTRCDLEVTAITRGELPDRTDAAQRITKYAADCTAELGPITTVTWDEKTRKKVAAE